MHNSDIIFLPLSTMKKTAAIALLSITAWASLQAQSTSLTSKQLAGQLNTVTTMVPFLTITPDSRSAAMGDVGVALFNPDANSGSWNMANLVHAKNKTGFSLSYAPWLRQLVDDVGFSYLSGYAKVGKGSAVCGSMRYFSLGNIQFTDFEGNPTGNFNPNEFAFDGGYATQFNNNFSMGVNLRFIYSNLTGNRAFNGIDYKAAMGAAGDVNLLYKTEVKNPKGGFDKLQFGLNIQNIGSKMTYSSKEKRDFIPTNLKLGVGYSHEIDDYNVINVYADVNKLLVPTRPYYLVSYNGEDSFVSGVRQFTGIDPNVNTIQGMIQSFYDAPGGFSEEAKEYNFSLGTEYIYNDLFVLRAGAFYEAKTKGGRQYGTIGLGLKYNTFTIDAAYLVPFANRHPLQNQMRFSLLFDLSALKDSPGTN
jgi:hypothetical protein